MDLLTIKAPRVATQTAALAGGRTMPQAPINLHVSDATALGSRAARVWNAPRRLALAIPCFWLRRCARISNKEGGRGRATDGGAGRQRGTRKNGG
eukprot:1658775-Pyramimonas_sp.AAC.1